METETEAHSSCMDGWQAQINSAINSATYYCFAQNTFAQTESPKHSQEQKVLVLADTLATCEHVACLVRDHTCERNP